MARPQPLVAGNWKMNGVKADLDEVRKIREAVENGDAGRAEILVCPPATLISAVAEIAKGSALKVGGQNCHREEKGAHTGDIAPTMLTDAGASYVILGHSERRADHGETNVAVRRKSVAALGAGLSVIICVGETKTDRDEGQAKAIVGRQLTGSLPIGNDARKIVVAYEPIWAIGTGVTPTAEDIGEMHDFMREELTNLFPDGGASIRLLYGGSVKPDNAAELMAVANVDGSLVGGASLKADDFLAIAAVYRESATAAE